MDRGGLRLTEYIMVHGELRIVGATLATFAALFGVALVLHGLFFDLSNVVLYGAATIGASVVAFVVMLTPYPTDIDDQQHQQRHRET